jgi:hypothetical protein
MPWIVPRDTSYPAMRAKEHPAVMLDRTIASVVENMSPQRRWASTLPPGAST